MRRVALCLALVCASCKLFEAPAATSPTVIVVRVQSTDANRPPRLRCVRWTLQVPGAPRPFGEGERCFLGPGRSSFPGEFAVHPSRPGAAAPVNIQVVAELESGATFTQLGTVEFIEGRTLLAVFDLNARCVGVPSCPAGLTCGGDGTCAQPILRRPLRDYTPLPDGEYADLDPDAGVTPPVDADVHDANDDVRDASVDVSDARAATDATDACTDCEGDGLCTDLRTDVRHCGACDRRCGLLEGCVAGACAPVRVESLRAGAAGVCARMSDGTVRCWGANTTGNLGVTVGAEQVSRPVRSSSFGAVEAVSLGTLGTCLVTGGAVRCAGVELPGVDGFTGVQSLAVGLRFACALQRDGAVRCVGENRAGTLGDGTSTDRDAPVSVTGLGSVVGLAAGYQNVCTWTGNGAASCWGANRFGQASGTSMACPGSTLCRTTPTAITGLPAVDRIATAGNATHGLTCALERGTRAVRCWGEGGLLGTGEAPGVDRPAPGTPIAGLRAAEVSVGFGFACALEEGGTVACWGMSEQCQAGVEVASTDRVRTPTRVAGLTDVRQLVTGSAFACALRGDAAEVWCWGANDRGQLGDGSASARSCTPTRVRW